MPRISAANGAPQHRLRLAKQLEIRLRLSARQHGIGRPASSSGASLLTSPSSASRSSSSASPPRSSSRALPESHGAGKFARGRPGGQAGRVRVGMRSAPSRHARSPASTSKRLSSINQPAKQLRSHQLSITIEMKPSKKGQRTVVLDEIIIDESTPVVMLKERQRSRSLRKYRSQRERESKPKPGCSRDRPAKLPPQSSRQPTSRGQTEAVIMSRLKFR